MTDARRKILDDIERRVVAAARAAHEVAKAAATERQRVMAGKPTEGMMLRLWERVQAVGGLQRIALALCVLETVEKNPQAFAAAVGSPALTALVEAFPDCKLVALRPMEKVGE